MAWSPFQGKEPNNAEFLPKNGLCKNLGTRHILIDARIEYHRKFERVFDTGPEEVQERRRQEKSDKI